MAPNSYNQKPHTIPFLQNRIASGPGSTSRPQFPIKRLTAAEMQQNRDKGLCYNCDEKFVLGHRCKKQMLYLLQLDSTGELEEEACEEGIDDLLDYTAILKRFLVIWRYLPEL